MSQELIITAASSSFERSLLALAGSLNANWKGHPRLLVYDLGMSNETLVRLNQADIEVRKVPEFCPHWRSHFTWKLWCINDAPADNYLWLDAGVCVLRQIPEAFSAIRSLGYFAPSCHWPLRPTMSRPQQLAVGLDDAILETAESICGGVHGLSKTGAGRTVALRALEIGMTEENIQATEAWHRHDQALLSGLFYKHFGQIILSSERTYANAVAPNHCAGQKVWVHRGRMLDHDLSALGSSVFGPAAPHIPDAPPVVAPDDWLMRTRKTIARLRGRTPHTREAGHFVYDGVKDTKL